MIGVKSKRFTVSSVHFSGNLQWDISMLGAVVVENVGIFTVIVQLQLSIGFSQQCNSSKLECLWKVSVSFNTTEYEQKCTMSHDKLSVTVHLDVCNRRPTHLCWWILRNTNEPQASEDTSDLLQRSFTGLCVLHIQYEHLSLCIHSQTDTPAVLDYSLAGQTLPQLTPIG